MDVALVVLHGERLCMLQSVEVIQPTRSVGRPLERAQCFFLYTGYIHIDTLRSKCGGKRRRAMLSSSLSSGVCSLLPQMLELQH